MNVLVTGGCGYLGSVIVGRLLTEGHDVTVLDSMLFGNSKLAHTLVGEVTDTKRLSKALDDKDAVVHLASIVGEGACNLFKETAVRVNYIATRSLATICKERSIKLLFASTASVYGVSKSTEALNEQGALWPLSVYALTKLAAEDFIRSCCQDYVIFRLGTLHGISKRMRFDLAINRFIAKGAAKEEIMVFGGAQRRPFIHVRDACEFFTKALEAGKQGLFNLGGDNYRIIDIANIISRRFGTHVSVLPELRDPRDYEIDSTLAVRTFKVRPERTVEDSIKEIVPFVATVDYRDSKFNNEEWLRNLWSH